MNQRRASTLIELLAYLALFSVILTLAFGAYHQADQTARGLSRNAMEIVQAVQAGEAWRRDVRGAVASPRLEVIDGAEVLLLPQTGGEVRYHFGAGKVWRQETNQARPVVLIPAVLNSRFHPERRAEVRGWRWELELQSRRTNSAIRPLFTFLVPNPKGSAR